MRRELGLLLRRLDRRMLVRSRKTCGRLRRRALLLSQALVRLFGFVKCLILSKSFCIAGCFLWGNGLRRGVVFLVSGLGFLWKTCVFVLFSWRSRAEKVRLSKLKRLDCCFYNYG